MSELNNNQTNQGRGGRREGAGRPKGSGHKPKLSDDLTEEQKQELVTTSFQKAVEGDSRLQVFFLEQIYGKAKQQVAVDGGEDDDGNLMPVLVKFINAEDDRNTN